MSMSIERFIQQSVGWLQARADRVPYNWPVKGGCRRSRRSLAG